MSRATIGTINPSTTSGAQLATLLNNRELAENSGHVGTGRPTYAQAGMIYSENSGASTKLFLAVGVSGPDVDLSALFADRPGTLRVTAEVRLPSGWLWADGAAVSRASFPDLLAAIAPTFTGTLAVGSANITSVSEDFSIAGLVGAPIEGTGIPVGTTITVVTGSGMTMSQNATAAGTGVALRAFPSGNGNASTTFNTPNCKGRVVIGRQNMGGTDVGLVTPGVGGVDGSKLANAGGTQSVVLSAAQLPAHSHPASSSGTVAIDVGGSHAHSINITSGAAGSHSHAPQNGDHFYTHVASGGSVSAGTVAGATLAQSLTTAAVGNHTHPITGSTSTDAGHTHTGTLSITTTVSNSAGGGTAVPLVQPGIVENVVVKT